MKEERTPFKKFTEGDFIHEIRRLNRIITKVSNERDNLQSQLKAKEEVIKEAMEYLHECCEVELGVLCEYGDNMNPRKLGEILSKGENNG